MSAAKTASATQKFYTNAGLLQNATNNTLAVGIVNSNSTAKFFAKNSPASIVQITGTRSGNQTTFRLFETGRIFGAYGIAQGNALYFANDVSYTTWTY
ncbi:MAG: hypothetical protein RR576_09690 [Oscillospiraceae bacterium]